MLLQHRKRRRRGRGRISRGYRSEKARLRDRRGARQAPVYLEGRGMIDTIIESISARLRDAFGESCAVFTEQPQQGAAGPCFFVSLLKSSQSGRRGRKSVNSQFFDVRFIPESGETFHREADAAADKLYAALETLDVEGMALAASEMSCEKGEGVQHFYVRYDLYLQDEPAPQEAMESLAVETGVAR